jgi:hypothetical protein
VHDMDIHPDVVRAYNDTAALTRFVWRAITATGVAPTDLRRALANAEVALWDAIQLHHGVCTCQSGLGFDCPSLTVHEDLYIRLHDEEESGRFLGRVSGPMADDLLWSMDVVLRHV